MSDGMVSQGITIKFGADLTGFKSGVSDVTSSLGGITSIASGVGSGISSIFGGVVSGAFGIAGQAVGFLKNQLSDSISVAMAHQGIMAQTAQVVKSTGDVSGMTAQAISDLGVSLSHVTTFSDDTIQSGENLLLTFTGIGKDVFPATTKTMLDMAQAMGGDTKGAALMLGKALNDPTTGLSALTRVGVTFSTQEKEQIKTMMAHNDVVGAQKVMLKELQTEFGGSAEAAGKTFAGSLQILKNDMMDVKQQIGGALLPVLQGFTGFVTSTAMPALEGFGNWFANTIGPALQGFGNDVGKISAYVGNVLKSIDLSDFNDAWTDVKSSVRDVGQTFQSLTGAASPLGYVLKQLGSDADPVTGIILKLAHSGLDILTSVLWKAYEGISAVTGVFHGGKGPLEDFGNSLKPLGSFIQSVGSSLSQLSGPVNVLASSLKGELGKELKDLGEDAKQVGTWFMKSVLPAIQSALPGFTSLASTILGTVLPAFIGIRGVVIDVLQHAFEKFAPILEKIVPPLIKFAGVLAGDVANGLKFIMPYVLQAAQAIGKFADQIIDRVVPIVTGWINSMMPLVQGFMSWWNASWPSIAMVLKGTWDEIVGWIKIAWALVSGIILIGMDALSGNWGQMWTDIKNTLAGVWDGIKDILHGAWEMIVGIFTGIYDDLVGHSIIPDMINGIVSWFEQLPGRAMAFITNLVDNITTTLGGLGASALTWAQDMISNFVSGILGGIGAVGDAVSQIASKIAGFLHFSKPDVGPLADVDTWMPDFGDILSKGLSNQVSKMQVPALEMALKMNLNPAAKGSFVLNDSTASLFQSKSNFKYPSMASQGGTSHPVVNVTVNVPPNDIHVDGKKLASALGGHIVNQIRMQGGVNSR